MHRRKEFNEAVVRGLAEPDKGSKVYFFRGAIVEGRELASGLGVRVTAGGAKAFTFDYRDASRKKRRDTIGRWPTWSCVDAAREARKLRQALDRGEPIGEARPEASAGATGPAVDAVLDDFVERYVRPELRSADEVVRLIDKDIRPSLGAKRIHDVRRSDINAMMTAIRERSGNKKRNGKVTAERTLSVLRKCFNWYATESDDPHSDSFVSPIARGMARVKAEERAERIGRRVLCKDRKGQGRDDELHTLWLALEKPEDGRKGTRNASGERLPKRYPAFIRTLLRTAQRRGEVAGMHEREILDRGKGDWLWIIPAERYKTKREQLVPLSSQVVAELKALGVKPGGKRYVFTEEGTKAFSDFSGPKGVLNKRLAALRKSARQSVMANWGLHDLRRTARTLMSRSEVVASGGKAIDTIPPVPVTIAEMCLGHVPPGLVDTYDQNDYLNEMRAALQLLADRIDRIVGW